MQTSLLSTKLLVPPVRQGLVPRPRLMECLKAVVDYRLILISAPAGFGKTTLASQWAWLNRELIRTAWVDLDEGDNDPVRFWDYVMAALRTLWPTAGGTALALLNSSDTSFIESVLTELINDLADVPDDFALVLDDYHLITAEPVHAALTFLIDHLPRKMHLVVATRTDPPLPLARLRGRGTMLEIGADDLRFTSNEAEALLKATQDTEMAAEDINALNERTEGWAVGLKMATLSLRGRKDIGGFLASFTGSQRHVMDYLLEEVLKRQTEEVRDFLLETSVLEKLAAPLCDAVTGGTTGREMLVRLESSLDGFLVPMDESREWYRYHRLFADLLRHQLELAVGRDQVGVLHQRASRWYEEKSLVDEAVQHSILAGDWESVTRLVGLVGERRLKNGEWSTVLGWLKAVPEGILRGYPRVYSQYANVLLTIGQLEAAETALGYLERTAQEDTSLQGEVALFQAMLAGRRGDMPGLVEMNRKALTLLPQENLGMRARASFVLGLVESDGGRLQEAWSLFSDAWEMGRKSGDYWIAASAAGYLGFILWMRGRLHEAIEIGQQGADLAGRSPAAAPASCLCTNVLYELNDLEAVERSGRRTVELCELSGQVGIESLQYFRLAQRHLAQGDTAAAETEMKKGDQAFQTATSEGGRSANAVWRMMVAIQSDDLAAASEWGKWLRKDRGLGFYIQHFRRVS